MIKAYRYKILPNKNQQEKLNQFFGCARFVYNWGLNFKTQSYKLNGKNVSYLSLAKELTNLKHQEETKWLNETPNVCLQQSLRNLDVAFTSFFRKKNSYPKFKSKKNHKDSIKFINSVHFDFEEWKVKLPKIGKVKLCKNRIFNQKISKQGTCTVSKDAVGTYWCVVLIDDNTSKPLKAKMEPNTAVGIDLGIKDYAILSDGKKFSNPKFFEKNQKKLKILQKKFSRTHKDSKRREKMRIKIAKFYRKINNKKIDFLHKISTYLIQNYDTICLENLNIEGLLKNHNLAKSIKSASWNLFKNQLEYKANFYGKNIIFIGRFEPSSKMCHCCGYINKDLKLSDRKWECPICGTIHDRDINAAKNILSIAFDHQNLIGL